MALDVTQQKLGSMLKNAPDQSTAVQSSIDTVSNQITELGEQSTALQTSLTDVAETNAIDIIENTILPNYPGGYVIYGPGFGTIAWSDPGPIGNISNWGIWRNIVPVPPPILPAVPTLIYPYTPGDYPDLDQLVADYVFGNSYITRPLTTGASYGLNPSIAALGIAKNLLEENKSILDQSVNILPNYV
jgi:hypothetical protein